MACQLPDTLRPLRQYLRVADELGARQPVVAYWCRLHAMQTGMRLDRESAPARETLMTLMTQLEAAKAQHAGDPCYVCQVQAQAVVEAFALRLFGWADGEDRGSRATSSVVRAFLTAATLLDLALALASGGGGGSDSGGGGGQPELSDAELHQKSVYAKWRATHIHQCLSEGRVPTPAGANEAGAGVAAGGGGSKAGATAEVGWTTDESADQMADSQSEASHHSPHTSSHSDTWPRPSTSSAPSSSQLPTPSAAASGAAAAAGGGGAGSWAGDEEAAATAAEAEKIVRRAALTSQVQRQCRLASAALDYDDVETARHSLLQALQLLDQTH